MNELEAAEVLAYELGQLGPWLQKTLTVLSEPAQDDAELIAGVG